MGRIAPKKRKSAQSVPLMQRITQLIRPHREEETMPNATSSRTPQWASRVWHLTDNLRWMDPLPAMHRRGIVLALIVLLVAILWPAPTTRYPVEQPVTPSREVPMQAELQDNTAAAPAAKADSQGAWRSYQIASGQTLAQLFRDNNLPVNDVFAMAQVEGDDKPLSTLRSGQQVKIRQDAQGVVTGLTIETDNGPVLFTRQPDGSFLRAQ